MKALVKLWTQAELGVFLPGKVESQGICLLLSTAVSLGYRKSCKHCSVPNEYENSEC